ncbi:tetratricopeptide repeat protein [Candidatus Gottesmanbacteria bacterium]|nr:tetratricopeptide repeat protein [Candidatus Gottesmanbacteria bacterium]
MPAHHKDPVNPQMAIGSALKRDWKEAIRINTLLVKANKTDIDALNRLGYAWLMTGHFKEAKRVFEKVLKLDPYNQIALKNSKKLANLKRKDIAQAPQGSISPLYFLEEPGKTKIVSCVNPAPSRVLSAMSAGQEVLLKAKNHCVEIRSDNNIYLGVLPDDVSFKLIKLLAAGNTYQVIVKSIGNNVLTVLLREQTRGKRFANQPSFTSLTSYIPVGRNEEKSEGPDVTATGEDERESGASDDSSF